MQPTNYTSVPYQPQPGQGQGQGVQYNAYGQVVQGRPLNTTITAQPIYGENTQGVNAQGTVYSKKIHYYFQIYIDVLQFSLL